MRLQSLQDVFAYQLEDLYSAETQQAQTLPRIAAAAKSEQLRHALGEHSKEASVHISRLTDIFDQMGIERQRGHRCEAMVGLLADGETVVNAEGEGGAKDVALIAAYQRVGHYEIDAYDTARTLADELGHDHARELLDITFNDESGADKLLTRIATGGLFKSGLTQQAHATEAVSA